MTTNQQQFATIYREELERAVAKAPSEYMLREGESAQAYADRVAPKMIAAFLARSANMGPAAKAACKRLGLKPTYTALYGFLAA